MKQFLKNLAAGREQKKRDAEAEAAAQEMLKLIGEDNESLTVDSLFEFLAERVPRNLDNSDLIFEMQTHFGIPFEDLEHIRPALQPLINQVRDCVAGAEKVNDQEIASTVLSMTRTRVRDRLAKLFGPQKSFREKLSMPGTFTEMFIAIQSWVKQRGKRPETGRETPVKVQELVQFESVIEQMRLAKKQLVHEVGAAVTQGLRHIDELTVSNQDPRYSDDDFEVLLKATKRKSDTNESVEDVLGSYLKRDFPDLIFSIEDASPPDDFWKIKYTGADHSRVDYGISLEND